MARRKKDTTPELISMGLFAIVILTAFATQSFVLGIFLAILAFTVILILTFIKESKKNERIKKSGILEIDKMTGVQFEEYLRLMFINAGYKVKRTPVTGDFGADLILEKNEKRIAVQAKRYKSNVGIKAVQEASSSRFHYKAHETWVVTNSNFTQAAKELSQSNKVRLVGREKLIEMLL